MSYGTTDRCTGGTITASSEAPGFEKEKAFDNNLTTNWGQSGTAKPQWIKYDFGAGVTWRIGKIIEGAKNASANYRPKAVVIEGSNNNSNWTELWSGNMVDSSAAETITFENSTAYRYIRLTVNSCWGSNSSANFFEISMYEILPVKTGGLAIGSPWIF